MLPRFTFQALIHKLKLETWNLKLCLPSINRDERPMPRVLVTPTILRHVPGPYSDTLLRGGCEIIYPPEGCDTTRRENLLPLLARADAMIASVEKLTREVLAGTKLRAVARMGVGYDAI